MATNYTAYQTACNAAQAALNNLAMQISHSSAGTLALTGTYDASGDLVSRMNAIVDWCNFQLTEVARTQGSIAS